MNLRKGFSLIELLVVIAIIGILAGIAFPVFARAKDSAYRSSDMAKMNELRTALQLYRTDQGAMPPALLGYATGYVGSVPSDPNPTATNIVPANQAVSALFPKRVPGITTFTPAYDRGTGPNFNKEFKSAVWPPGEGITGNAGEATQRYGPNRVADRCVNGATIPRLFYKLSGFDAATVPIGGGQTRHELRYSLFFTGYTVPADPCNPTLQESGGAGDDVRQLGYSDPPDTTVVTWDTYFREYDAAGNVVQATRDIVLFLGGSAKMMDSKLVASRAWKVTP
jgi:prepilin-type N-terminal cleavage/methylation domain-containing protein